MVNNLLEMYTTSDIIAKTDSEISGYVKPSTMSQLEFVNELWFKMLTFPHFFDEHVLKWIIVD